MSHNWRTYVIAMLFLLLAGALYWAFHERDKANRILNPKLDFSYDVPRNIVISRWKDSGSLESIDHDRNRDERSDSIIYYGTKDRITSIYVDEDFNDRFEVQYLYDTIGRLVGKYEDIGQDGFFEEYVRITKDSIHIYRDRDLDSYFAPNELIRSERRGDH